MYDRSDSSEYLLYDFISDDRTIWERPYETYSWGIFHTTYDYNYYLNTNRYSKIYDWVEIDSSSDPIDTVWGAFIDVWPIKITQGIGVSDDLYGAIISGDTLGTITSIIENEDNVENFQLFNNYPNPFNPTTTIHFHLPIKDNVKLSVYNSLGQLVKVLINQKLLSGNYQIEFNGQNLSSGVYYYVIRVNNFQSVKKMLLLK
jgi:hypothetical protein